MAHAPRAARYRGAVPGDLLDLILIALAAAFAVAGYRQGFIVGVLSFVGFLGGAAVGAIISPHIARALAKSPSKQALVAIIVVFLTAMLGQLVASLAGVAVRSRVTWRPATLVDSVGGAAVSIISVLLIAWLIGSAVVNAPFPARVVLYDPERDVAILYVPGLAVPALRFRGPAARGDEAIVAGYPLNSHFTAVPARIGAEEQANSPDIYQVHTVSRSIYAIRAVVLPGNSGGPLLTPHGGVYGVVFAASPDVSDTGYALTASEVAPDVTTGRAATAEVSTQGCD